MIKIYIPPIEKFELQRNKGEINHILRDGIVLNTKTKLVNSPDESDFIFLDFRHLNSRSGYTDGIPAYWNHKIVVIDYSDSTTLFDIKCPYYFKRSIVDKSTNTYIQYDRKVYPISYAIKNNCLNHDIKKYRNRELDIAVFLRSSETRKKLGMRNREIVAEFISQKFNHKNIFVGISGTDGESGRMGINNQSYYETMLNAKIVVTCNPDNWEGDYRLFEALSCGPLVMVDSMITPVKYPFISDQHLIHYDTLDYLANKINYYLKNDEQRIKIANSGYQYAQEHHKTSDRIDEILEIIL